MEYTIKQVCQKYGLNASTLRYYEKERLLPPIKKNSSNQRIYNEDDLKWLEIIMCMRKTGMTIAYIRNYVDLCKQGNQTLDKRYDILKKQKEILMLQLQELNANIEMIDLKLEKFQNKL
ncbi:MerR family transcriptional regulator [Thomasclavelia sp.]|uniref:MerR family transcriptional regulator n=1 Tax=Thomasclavelia sp. TaxID=3025757 RepID=UPI0025DC3FF0|nr:MerR family transcriptional regulator [Thomasclavelia sp.]